MPENVELDNSPYEMTVVYDRLEAAFANVSSAVDRMQKELGDIRRFVAEFDPQPHYSIEDYDRWAREYYECLRQRVLLRRHVTDREQVLPLVSVLVPAFRPLMSDFVAAIESVLGQTYSNWELIIVDDASNRPELTSQIKEFCRRDSRVRAVPRYENGNISEATNTAIAAARGEWLAFFDHDDLLVDVALEVMVDHAVRTGATVLYSDEDKIDQEGFFSEPNFKPDWNHRYILGVNYVCHLLFVNTEIARNVGPLKTKYNGSQDHDFVLRLSEQVPSDRIHHVPEMLYHWRKTPNSTAVSISNKGYAVDAGIAAVGDHLARIGAKASVSSIEGHSIYKVDWLYSDYPKVCIIIPFKDRIDMTRLCLKQIQAHTNWPGLQIIFVDNWSITEEAVDFKADVEKLPGVVVLTVEEDFNYARLNNIAAAHTDAEYLVFMNNDLLVKQDDWLRILVNEALADEKVAVVGGKFLYPDGSVQHVGVLVNPDEVGVHAHLGIAEENYGYIGRAVLSHELTAVTAACMLARARVFHDVGGFDEKSLKVAFNDVDFCLKVRSHGWKVVLATDFVAEHHESYSRGSDERPENEERFRSERRTMLERWGDVALFKHDPACNPHFPPQGGRFSELRPPTFDVDASG